jgi:hypothetical protein
MVLNKTYEEIGEEFDLSRERVRQIQNKAMEEIKKSRSSVENRKAVTLIMKEEHDSVMYRIKKLEDIFKRTPNLPPDAIEIMFQIDEQYPVSAYRLRLVLAK